jgi:hypothetical protein
MLILYLKFRFKLSNTVNPRYIELMGGGGGVNYPNVLCDQMKGFSRKYTIGYIANTRNKRRHTQCDYIKMYIYFFILNSFLTTNPS